MASFYLGSKSNVIAVFLEMITWRLKSSRMFLEKKVYFMTVNFLEKRPSYAYVNMLSLFHHECKMKKKRKLCHLTISFAIGKSSFSIRRNIDKLYISTGKKHNM